MVNQSVNEFYTCFLFKIDALTHNFTFPLDIDATFFDNLSPGVREFLISEGFQVHPRPPTEKNHQRNQRLILVKNVAVGAQKKIRTIKLAVQPEIGSCRPKILMGILAGNPQQKWQD